VRVNLLLPERDFDFQAELPPSSDDLAQDLEVGILLDAMGGGDPFVREVCRRVVLRPLDSPGRVRFRQDVVADARAEPSIIQELYVTTSRALQEKRGIWGLSSQYPSSILSGAITQLELFVPHLRRLRALAERSVGRVRSRGLVELFAGLRHDLDDEYFAAISRQLARLRFRDGVVLSAGLGDDNGMVDIVLRSSESTRSRWKDRLHLGAKTSYSFVVPPRDEAGGQALSELTNRGVNAVANAAAQSAEHISSFFRALQAEVAFYVGCLNLADRLAELGEATSFPEPLPRLPLRRSAADLRDPCLALQSGRRVVGNGVDADDRPLVVITGANSGGKSTFLRSMGLAQLMMECGMFVAASRYRSSLSGGVFTHFPREEDATIREGRFEDELRRMRIITDRVRPGSLVLCNESFASTNEREGSEIALQVATALADSGVAVIFVTHLFDFADELRRTRPDEVRFLRASPGDAGERRYELHEATALPTSHALDLYDRLGHWPRREPLGGDPGGSSQSQPAGDGRRPEAGRERLRPAQNGPARPGRPHPPTGESDGERVR